MTDAEIFSLRHGDVILIDRGERSYELSRLIDRGWNVAKEIVRELKEASELKARGGYSRLKPERCALVTRRLTQAARNYRTLKTEVAE